MNKRHIGFLTAGMFIAVCAVAATNVVSVNVVGYSKADLEPSGLILRGMPFDSISGSSQTLIDIFGTNSLAQDGNYLNCDRIMIYDAAGSSYQAYAQYTDGIFYLANDNAQWLAGIASNPVVEPGTSFWIIRSASASTTNELTFLGEVVDSSTQQVAVAAGYQLLSYAFSSDIAIQDVNTNGMASDGNYLNCDRIVTWEGGSYQTHALYTDGVWYHANDNAEWLAGTPSTRVLKMGEGFWFIAQSAGTWTETNKYLGNL